MDQMKADLSSLPAVLDVARKIACDFWDESAKRPAAVVEVPSIDHWQLPETGPGAAAALGIFQKEILPHFSASVGPRYFGFVTGGATPAALAGDWLAGATDQNPASPGDSIAADLIDQTVKMLLDLFHLPQGAFDGALTTGATAANLLGLTTGREWCARNAGIDVTNDGMTALGPVQVFSACPHASLIKVLGISGIGRKAWVPVGRIGESEAMDPEALDAALAASDNPNKIVVASTGTVTANDFDDLEAIADICERNGAWLHVDAAFGIFARCLPEMAPLAKGLERADSITADGHKWLNVPYDCGIFFTRHIDLLERAHGVHAAYLKTEAEAPTYGHRGVENSQRLRALPAWMTLQAYGRKGVEDIVRVNCSFAAQLGAWIDASDAYELLCPVKLNVVTFRGRFTDSDQDRMNADLLRAINRDGRIFCTPGVMNGQSGIRAAISNWRTDDADLDIAITALSEVHATLTAAY
ncbi:pyridoxal phosphate-dependent decarboxylase family protein [Aestuariispira insulae]|uniref:Glutamate/tyrosine decarboxylase-like PLP-dependent enzyme n=1 Tax=Aestuariispira insulae TaxID=1461337 RepID=A0A3D9HKI8_9PROT|nr:pyridoxal-dependent decarboxylase [Aestuariispira insulae]RED49801.1 glutamate/tyrosine decarboxylase-like PLP-dependent enzyme [Aestuariispira insulae]